jgi:hypothetical protein
VRTHGGTVLFLYKVIRPSDDSCYDCAGTMQQLGEGIVSMAVASKRHVQLSCVVSVVDSVCMWGYI